MRRGGGKRGRAREGVSRNKARVAEAARGIIQMKCVSVSRSSTEIESAIVLARE